MCSVSTNWSHHPRYPLPEVRVAAPSVEGDLQERRTRLGNSLILHPTPAPLARLQPHPAEIRRWRRQSVQMGRKICVCLSRCNPWRDISSGVGNSSAQTVDAHVPREWEDPQAKRGGGMERSGSLCGRVADPREPLLGRQCCSIGKKMRMLLWSKGAKVVQAGMM